MLFDKQNQFSDAQTITATAVSTNVIDFGGGIGDPSFGTPKPIVIQVVEAFEGVTSVAVSVETSETEDFASVKEIASSAAIAVADLKEGYKFPINYLPKGCKRYNRLKYTVAGTGTAGKITAGFIAADDNSYQDM